MIGAPLASVSDANSDERFLVSGSYLIFYQDVYKRQVLGMLQDLHKQGNTVVLITHDNSIAVQAERIIRLEDGRVVYDGDAHAPEAVVQPNFMMAEPKAGEEGTQA